MMWVTYLVKGESDHRFLCAREEKSFADQPLGMAVLGISL